MHASSIFSPSELCFVLIEYFFRQGHVVQSEPLSCFVHAAIADIRLLTTNQLLVPVHLLCGHTLVRKQGEIPLECSFCGVGVISIDQQSQLSVHHMS
jgi:hypothetical protein